MRHVNLPPNPPLVASPKGSYLHGLLKHMWGMYVHLIGLDLATYIPYRLAPKTFGSYKALYPSVRPDRSVPLGNFSGWCADLGAQWGIPAEAVRVLMTFLAGAAQGLGLCCTWHLCCVLYVGSGLWLEEECPRFWNQPWKSTSLNELWGQRYHQTLRVSRVDFRLRPRQRPSHDKAPPSPSSFGRCRP